MIKEIKEISVLRERKVILDQRVIKEILVLRDLKVYKVSRERKVILDHRVLKE